MDIMDKVIYTGFAVVITLVVIAFIFHSVVTRSEEFKSGLIGQPRWSLRKSVIVTAVVFVVGIFLCMSIASAAGAI